MSLSLNDIAKKDSEQPDATIKKIKFSTPSMPALKEKKTTTANIPKKVNSELKKPWVAQTPPPAAPQTPPPVQAAPAKPTTFVESPIGMAIKGLKLDQELIHGIERLESWVSSIELKPKLRIPLPSIFTHKDED